VDLEFTKEQKLLQETYREFCKRNLTREYVRWLDENTTFLPQDMYDKLAELGTMGICIPPEYGGMGLGEVEHCIIMEEISRAGVAVGFCSGVA